MDRWKQRRLLWGIIGWRHKFVALPPCSNALLQRAAGAPGGGEPGEACRGLLAPRSRAPGLCVLLRPIPAAWLSCRPAVPEAGWEGTRPHACCAECAECALPSALPPPPAGLRHFAASAAGAPGGGQLTEWLQRRRAGASPGARPWRGAGAYGGARLWLRRPESAAAACSGCSCVRGGSGVRLLLLLLLQRREATAAAAAAAAVIRGGGLRRQATAAAASEAAAAAAAPGYCCGGGLSRHVAPVAEA